MLRYLPLLLAFTAVSLAIAEDSLPGVNSVDASFGTNGKETYGHITSCVVDRDGVPLACFGLTKEAKTATKYTYFLIFKQDPKKPLDSGGTSSEFNVDAGKSTNKVTFDLGEHELVLDIARKLDPTNGKVLEGTIKIGDKMIGKGGSLVMVLDYSSGKLVARPIEAELPKSAPDLGDQEHRTWIDSILKAIAEVKDQSPEAKALLK